MESVKDLSARTGLNVNTIYKRIQSLEKRGIEITAENVIDYKRKLKRGL